MAERPVLNRTHRLVRPGFTALGISLAFLVGYTAYWLEFGLVDFPFGVPGPFYLLGAVLAVQLARSVQMNDWVRRGAAVGTVGGALAMIAGLGGTASCPKSTSYQCTTSLNPNVSLMVAGVLLTTTLLTVDIVRRRDAASGRQ